jgi:hypothetical protein
MKTHPFEKAINEQTRGLVAANNLEKGIKGKCLTKEQIWVSRKKTETIMVEMLDKMRIWEKANRCKPKKSRKCRKRRSPRVPTVKFNQI